MGRRAMEKSNVYVTSFKASGHENLLQKLHRLMKTAGFESIDFTDIFGYLCYTGCAKKNVVFS